MAPLFVYLTVPIFLLCLVVARQRYSQKKNNRRLPPSPPSCLPIIGHLHLLNKNNEPLHHSLTRISSLHGAPLLLLWFGSRPVLLVSSPEAAEECLTIHDRTFANRPRTAAGKYLGFNFTAVTFAPYGPHWRNLRRLTAMELFSTHRLNEFSAVRFDEVRFLIARLAKDDATKNGTEDPRSTPAFRKVTLKPLLFEVVCNNMMRMMVGRRYFREGEENVEHVRRFYDLVEEGFRLIGATNLADFIPALRWVGFGGLDNQLKALKMRRDKFFQELIDQHRVRKKLSADGCYRENCGGGGAVEKQRHPGRGRTTTLDVLLSLQEEDPDYYTDDIIKGNLMAMLNAGTDTSALTTEWAMTLLLNHKDRLFAVQAEIDSVVGANRLVTDSDLPQLPYLQAVISETLRVYPAGPLLVPHESSEDCIVAGFHVPRGTMLVINAWAIQRSKNVWDEPMEFKPERFLKKGVDGNTGNYKMIPFGSGRRRCPGEALALRMVGLTLAALLQCFDWERVGPHKVDMEQGKGLTMPKAVPLEAMCRPRETMPKIVVSGTEM